MTEAIIITGATAAGDTLYAAVDRVAGRIGAIGHSEATARLAPYRNLRIAIEEMIALGAIPSPKRTK